MDDSRCRLYLITPVRIDPALFADDLSAALDAGDVACVQLRLKNVDDDAVRRAVETLLPIAQARGVALIVNDRPDLAAETGADGVHVGQHDTDYRTARAAVGAERIVGVTCHDSRDLAMRAGEQGADYVAFGAFFPTATKEAKTRADPETLKWWSGLFVVPCVAIGGITIGNCGALVRAGADFIAVVSAVWDHPEGPAKAVAAFNEAIGQATGQGAGQGPD